MAESKHCFRQSLHGKEVYWEGKRGRGEEGEEKREKERQSDLPPQRKGRKEAG